MDIVVKFFSVMGFVALFTAMAALMIFAGARLKHNRQWARWALYVFIPSAIVLMISGLDWRYLSVNMMKDEAWWIVLVVPVATYWIR